MSPRDLFDRLLHRDDLDRSLNEEIQFHIGQRAQDLEGSGMTPQEAERRARIEFGSAENYKEQCRESRRLNGLHTFLADIRFGLRMLRRSPGFSVLAILCLTLGIGANAAVLSWIEGTLLRPYPAVADQAHVLVLAGTARGTPGFDGMSWPDLLDIRRNCRLLDAVIAEKIVGTTLSIGDRAERATGSLVSANYFDAMGIRPVVGRGFQPGEDVGRNAHPVVVISYGMWRDRFRGDPKVIGKTQTFNGMPHTIVGVAPEGFYGTFVGYEWQFWVPLSMQERFEADGYTLEERGARWIEPFVRLKPGVTLAQAQQEVSSVARRLEADFPDTNRGRGVRLLPLWESPFNASTVVLPTLKITAVVTFLVLLIACANVSNLLLVRAFARRHEMSVRLAVGAGRTRLIKQLMTEGLLLSVISLVGGILVAQWCRNLLVLLIPNRGVKLHFAGQLDWRVVALSAAVCLLATLFFAVIPAIQSSNVDIAGTLKNESAGVIGGRHGAWLRSSLVLVQVALSFLLLVGAGLLLQSLSRIRTADPGFSADDVLATHVGLFDAGYEVPRARIFEDQFMDRVRALPGVESAAYSRVIPFTYQTYSSSPITVDGYQAPPDEQPAIEYSEVSPGYFATIGIPVIAGREFARSDDENAPPVAIVNESMAAQYWRGADPIGRRLEVKGRWMQVVGVAKNAKYSDMVEPLRPFFYVPLRQNFFTESGLLIRTRQNPASLAPLLAKEMHSLDPDLAPYGVITLREQLNLKRSTQRIAGILLAVFGGLALLLATVGLYGVMAYTVSQSTRELGLRVALGAAPVDLLRLLLSRGLWLTAAGVLVGAAAALAATRLLGYMLYKVSPRDPLSFACALLMITIASMAACLPPAWRATRTDPIRALRD
ncbi:MAG TPA: ABC transporter permease [Terriglobales bacterium]|nr:ABC transporter permease [Terriglobales bacterium]